jgi:ferrous iron transport protein A
MKSGQSGTVVQVVGGMNACKRLQGLGIRIGKKITKTSSMFMRGPVSVKTGHTKIAIGFGLAGKVIVELDD